MNVKTTIVIPEEVLEELKIRAIKEKTTVSNLLLTGVTKLQAVTPRKVVQQARQKTSILDWAGTLKVKNPIPADKIRDYIDYSDL
jgi:hypothetical protein